MDIRSLSLFPATIVVSIERETEFELYVRTSRAWTRERTWQADEENDYLFDYYAGLAFAYSALGNDQQALFNAQSNFFGKQDGLVHISQLAGKRVNKVSDVVKEGDEVSVKVIGFDRGKVKLSIKEAS